MKKNLTNLRNLFLVLIIGTSVFSSCSKDDKTDDIVGTWTSGTTIYTAMVGSRELSQYFTEVMGLTTEQAQIYTGLANQSIQQIFAGTIRIYADNTYTSNLGGTTDTGTWSLSSDRKKLTINSTTDGPMTVDINELTSSKLSIHLSETISEDLNQDGTDEIINIEAQINFTK